MLIDTHAHLNFNAYKNDANEVIRRSLVADTWIINVGSQYSTSKRAVEIAQNYPEGVYAAVGLHPIHLETGLVKIKVDTEEIEFKTCEEDFDYEKYKALAQSSKVVAVGEIGLDYWYRPKTKIKLEQFKEKQKEVFIRQLELAQELNLPIILHCRLAHNDLIQTIKQFNPEPSPSASYGAGNLTIQGVVHCFTGTWEQAQKYMELGFHIGFNGIIFKLDLDEVIKKTPLEKILIETDCPYLTPPLPAEALAKAGQEDEKRNEPIFVKYIAQKIAEIKEMNREKIEEMTTANAKNLFRMA